ncbi:MAG: hypothetical protein WBS54_00460 [Acidobacteriota bacterium]
MAGEAGWRNKLYFGDNLVVLSEHVADEKAGAGSAAPDSARGGAYA